jgi:predicted ATPase/signal transduction histidine kinase
MGNATVELLGYSFGEQVYAGTRTLVYRGVREANRQPVVIKVLRNEFPHFNELVHFRNQYIIGKNLDFPGIIKTYSLERYHNSYALILEDFGGISLCSYFASVAQASSGLPISEFLSIAIQIAHTLDGLCRHRIIHKDLKPANIVINPTTKQVKLIDFSIASLLPRETQEIQNPNILEGTLPYLSPEQTGRMNRAIDYRTDFYSLGITFYELLTGQLPFQTDDPMDLVHCHLAKQPIPVHHLNSTVPPILSAIVSKLIAKNAEDRYQSALGLKYDLETCLHQWKETGGIADFELGARDLCDRFIIPEKLYGREAEVQALLTAFEQVSQGNAKMTLVTGFSGIGKTAVVNEVHKPIVKQRGYFIKGKFDQFGRNLPFSAFVQAFQDLMGQLLSETDAEVEQWKTQILTALGENAQVVVEVIPELERIIGQQPPAPDLSGSAAQNRFNRLFANFISVFSTQEHPLVIFLDDLQWADSASLNLIQLLTNVGEDRSYLFLIGAYRDNEVSSAHPLMLTLSNIQKAGARVDTITLKPLDRSDLNSLVADTLVCSPTLALPLTELIYQKTKGNPFFSTQFLKSLHEEGLITFNIEARHWQCDINTVRTLALTDDVVEFMALQLRKLPTQTQEILKLAACIGNQFDLVTLGIVSENSPIDTANVLWKALQEGLVLPINEVYKFYQGEENGNLAISHKNSDPLPTYKFLHDRVQQAAYSLIAAEQKQATHLKIGQLLLRNTPIQEREERIFAIVNQLNVGWELIAQPTELQELAQLNLMAGRKAKTSTAYAAAVKYLSTAMDLLSSDRWQTQYDLTLEIVVETADAEYLNTNFATASTLVEMVLQQGKTLLDRIPAYEIKIQVHMAQHQLNDAIDTGLQALEVLGYPVNLSEQEFLVELPTLECLEDYPTMTDAAQLAAMRILKVCLAPVLAGRPQILLPVVVRQVKLCLEGGHSPLASGTYAWYGTLLCGALGNIDAGYQAGWLALQLLKYFETKEHKVVTYNMFYTFVHHWKEPLRESISPLAEGVQIGLESGNYEYTGYCITNYCFYIFLAGENLETVECEHHKYHDLLLSLKLGHSISVSEVWYQLLLNLLGKAVNPLQLIGERFDESTMLSQLQEQNDHFALFNAFLAKTILFYLLEEFDRAVESAAKAASYSSVGSENFVTLHFYQSLSLLANYPNFSSEERSHYLSQVATNQEKMQLWMHHAPMNYEHKYHLVEAEKARVLGDHLTAINEYELAILGARANNYLHEEAIANELTAKFYLAWGKEKIAKMYLIDAYYAYSRWGAKAKIDDLEKRYPQLLASIFQQEQVRLFEVGTTSISTSSSAKNQTIAGTTSGTVIDLPTVIKASQVLSSEIQIDQLLTTLMQVAIKNAGSQTGVLILHAEENWKIAVHCSDRQGCSLQDIPLEESNAIPQSLINYVKRTQETLMFDDAKTQIVFAADPYMQQHQPKSVLCTPILHQGKMMAILYLENNLTVGAFTSDRVAILNILCSQAAISLQNARLYQQSQEYAQKLELYLTDLKQMQLQLVQNEKMSALGNLVAGVAHEINNPIGFIAGNLQPAQNYVQDLFNVIDLYQQKFPNPGTEIEEEVEAIDLEYLREDLPKLINSMYEGVDRIRNISSSLRTFSRADSDRPIRFNIHDGIDSTILILKHRLKASEHRPAIEVVKEYGSLPLVECFPGQLNQVFMNILANAIDALDEASKERSFNEIQLLPNKITIQTTHDSEDERVLIRIKDNGGGMSAEVQQKIFDHLFTTKAVGQGTGLGLSIARQIVTQKHGGTLEVNSSVGNGAEFVISLPLQG